MFAVRPLEEISTIELVTRLFLCLVIILATYNRVILARIRSSDRESQKMASNIEVTIDVPKLKNPSSAATASSPSSSSDQQRPSPRVHEEEFRYYGNQRHVEAEQQAASKYKAREVEQHHDERPRNEDQYRQVQQERDDEQRWRQQQAQQQQSSRFEQGRQEPPFREAVERVSEDERHWRQQQEADYAPQPERYVAQGDRYVFDQHRFKQQQEQESSQHSQKQQQSSSGEHQERHDEHQRLPSPPHPREQLVYVPVAQQQQTPSNRQSSPRFHDERRYSSGSEQVESRSRYSSVSTDQERVVLGSQQQKHHHQPPSEEQQAIRTKRASSLDASKLAHRVGWSLKVTPERIGVVIAGWPNELAIQCAKACVKRGFRMLPVGICMNESEDDRVDITDVGTIVLYRYGDSQLRTRLSEQLTLAAEKLELFPVIIDTSLQVDNIRLYQQFKVPFVFETRADSIEDHQRAVRETEEARCFALIAQRMDKHVAAVDSLFEDLARRFPGLFAEPIKQGGSSRTSSFEFTLKTSEPNEKVNRGLLNSMSDLLNKDIDIRKVQHLRTREETEHHGLVAQPQTTKEPHVKRVYEIRNSAGSCVFDVEQDVNATYECAEGVADSVTFIAQKAQETARPRVYDILDVAHAGRFLMW